MQHKSSFSLVIHEIWWGPQPTKKSFKIWLFLCLLNFRVRFLSYQTFTQKSIFYLSCAAVFISYFLWNYPRLLFFLKWCPKLILLVLFQKYSYLGIKLCITQLQALLSRRQERGHIKICRLSLLTNSDLVYEPKKCGGSGGGGGEGLQLRGLS